MYKVLRGVMALSINTFSNSSSSKKKKKSFSLVIFNLNIEVSHKVRLSKLFFYSNLYFSTVSLKEYFSLSLSVFMYIFFHIIYKM